MENQPYSPEEARPEDRHSEALALLTAGVESVLNERDFPEYLRTVSRLHTYSAGNISLIYMQKPDASMVAGYRKWQSMGRQVLKGERGITILTPRFRKKVDEDTGEILQVLTGFGTGKVFDVSQTEGDEISPSAFFDAGENVETASALCDRVMEFFGREKVLVQPDSIRLRGETRGSYNWLFKTVKYRPGMPAPDTAKTLVHEAAHHVVFTRPWGKEPKLRQDHEIVAEGAAFAVCERFGLDTGEYSFHYLKGWSQGDMEAVKQNLSAIQKTAHMLIEELENPRKAYLEARGIHNEGTN